MAKNKRVVVFTSSNENTSEEDLKKTLLKILQIHFNNEIKK